jgi:O-antigen/teichoic acid export membrane protein
MSPPETTEATAEPIAAPPESADLKRAALGGAAWLLIGFGATQAIRLISTIVLPALLYPEAFGLMGLALTVLVGLQMFSDIGIRTAIIHSQRGDDDRFLATAWTLAVIRGFILWGCACLLAFPMAFWRGQPEPLLLIMLPILGINAALEGFTSTSFYTLNRKLHQARVVMIEVGSAVIATTTTILWALLWPSPWALVGGAFTGATTRTLLSYIVLPRGHNHLCWDRESLRELSRIGRWIYLGTVCTFIAGYADKLVIGYLSVAALGVYWVVTQLAQMPVLLIQALASRLIFPLFSRMIHRGFTPRDVFGPIYLVANMAGALLIAGLLAVGPTAVYCLWDPRYHDAAWMVQILAVGVWLQIMEANAGSILFAQGHTHVVAASNAAKAASMFVFIPIGFAWGGLLGLILGFVAGDLVRYLVTAFAIRRRGLPLFRYDLTATVFVFVAGLGAAWAGEMLWPGAARSVPDLSAAWAAASTAPYGAEAVGSAVWGGYQRQWDVLLPRFATAAAIVVLAWGALVVGLRARGLLRWRW